MWAAAAAHRRWGRRVSGARHFQLSRAVCKEVNLQQSFADLIRYFTYTKDLEFARKIQGKIAERGLGSDRYLRNLTIEMYAKCGSFPEAKQVFDRLGSSRDEQSWGAMITGSSDTGNFDHGLDCYRRMLSEGHLPSDLVLKSALTCVETLPVARQMHDHVVSDGYDDNHAIITALLYMYRRCGRLDLAHEVFESAEDKSLYLRTVMLSVYADSPGSGIEGLKIFWSMEQEGLRPGRGGVIGWILASYDLGCGCYAKSVGERVAAHGLEKDPALARVMLAMHGRCGNVEEAKLLFDSVQDLDTMDWNSLLACYSAYGRSTEALTVFRTMDNHGFHPDHITYACVLDACADLSAVELGEAVHERVRAEGLESDVLLVSALVRFYGNCRKSEEARRVFEAGWKDVLCWTAMITAYAQNGEFESAMEIFKEMCHRGVEPDEATFIALLAACGKEDAARDVFRMVQGDFFQEPTEEQYGYMVDVLGRNKKLNDAEELLDNMPFCPDVVAWIAILRGCKSGKDRVRGSRLAEAALDSFPLQISGPHLLLSKMKAEIENLDTDKAAVEEKASVADLLRLVFKPCACSM